ncbi:MAG: hypothetical protein HY332_06985 [Chloroflexi bacterium]|nr:hypothetical protein [Chloroflexota bacterium]
MLHEEPETAAATPQPLESLIDDAVFMLGRMEQRLQEYERFRQEVSGIADALEQIGGSLRQEAVAMAPSLKAQLRSGQPLAGTERDTVVARAEAIRDVAQDTENKLNHYKELALALARTYRDVKGNRRWVLDEEEAAAAEALPGEPEWARWLPPSPHRERIIRWIQSGRAHLLVRDRGAADSGGPRDSDAAGNPSAEDRDQPPYVQFQDGGVMPLPDVRWSEEIRSFYAAGAADAPPNPRGRLYRDYAGRRVHPGSRQ